MPKQTQRQFAALMGRLGKPEYEFSQPWAPATTIKSPAGLRTDKFIGVLLMHWRGRLVIANAAIAALTVDSLGQLIQEIRVYGQHAVFGNIRPIVIRGGMVRMLNRIYRPNFIPRDQFAGGNTHAWGAWNSLAAQATGTYDMDIFWTLPVFPLPMSLNLAGMYSLKGPDWAGNLFMEMDCSDATALGGVNANSTWTAYGSGAGSPTVTVSVCRWNLGVATMNRLSPAIAFKSYKLLDSVLTGTSFSGQTITTLNIGKKLAAATVESGTLYGSLSSGMRAYSSNSDAMVTRVYVSLDGKALVNPESGFTEQEWTQWVRGTALPPGYNIYNFTDESGNPDSGFPAETLTAARRFEIDGDVTAASGQGGVLLQDEILGSPSLAAS
jgi:hypothetical protein